MTTAHTPTPWIQDGGYIFDDDHNIVGKTYDRRYADHIVKCVNMHDESVRQLTILKDSITGNCYLGEEAEISIIGSLLKKAGSL